MKKTADNMFEAVKAAYKAIDDKFGINIVTLHIGKISTLADYFIIASANSKSQLKAMSDEVEKKLFEQGIRLRHIEGISSNWVLLDFGSIIVHLFDKENREFYNLERIWADAEQIPQEQLI